VVTSTSQPSLIALTPSNAQRRYYGVEERIELWGLQIPHNSVRPQLNTDEAAASAAAAAGEEGAKEEKKEKKEEKEKDVITWTSVRRAPCGGRGGWQGCSATSKSGSLACVRCVTETAPAVSGRYLWTHEAA
jgi:hypothetical protein